MKTTKEIHIVSDNVSTICSLNRILTNYQSEETKLMFATQNQCSSMNPDSCILLLVDNSVDPQILTNLSSIYFCPKLYIANNSLSNSENKSLLDLNTSENEIRKFLDEYLKTEDDFEVKTIQTKSFAKLSIPGSNGISFVNINEIVRLKSDNNYSYIYTNSGKQYIIAKTLKNYESLLSRYGFIRVHRSHIINPDYILEYVKGKAAYLILTDKSYIEISFRKRKEVLEYLISNEKMSA